MKETINVNIGGQAFTMDKDAYQRLDDYLTDVRSRLNDPTGEVMSDIEGGIADIFSQALSSQVMVVTLQMVEAAIRRMGNPDDFGPAKAAPKGATKVNPSSQLRRSRTDRSIAGVCGGIAAYFKLEPSLVRLVMLLLFLFGGLSLWVYVILWLLIPEEE